MEVSKLEVARRQLDAAIELHFQDGDRIAIHALGAAAYEVINALRRRLGLPDFLEVWIVPERRSEFRSLWRGPQNFLKHADRDPDAVLTLRPFHTEVCLYEACLGYGSFCPESEAMAVFKVWFAVAHPELLADLSLKAGIRAMGPRWMALPRAEFRELLGEAARRSGTGV